MAGKWIQHWNPEDEQFWAQTGRAIARRNLAFSIFAEFLGFSVWQIWSVVTVNLPNVGFKFSVAQLFLLASLPGLVGATMRFPYTLAVPKFGGRNWTVVSALLLLIPCLAAGFMVQNPSTPFWALAIGAATAGFGAGNFASSMANISFYFPAKHKGLALGLNAGGGNLGVSVVQFAVPIAIAAGVLGAVGGGPQTLLENGLPAGSMWLQNAGVIWVPFILLAAVCAWLFMDNLAVSQARLKEQAVILKSKHTYLMSWLYIGTFGSFIGYGGAFPLLIKSQFPGVNPLQYAFLGPLVGSLLRPLGGWLSDRVGGAWVTLCNFIVMIGAVAGVIFFLDIKTQPGAFWGFFAMFLILFATAGLGNGSTFRMIPGILQDRHMETAATLGFTSAIGAYGGFLVPNAYSTAISATGGVQVALYGFIAFYLSCVVITAGVYVRRPRTVARSEPATAVQRAVA